MKILLIGATGAIGSRILNEATSRGHDVTAVSRKPGAIKEGEHVHIVQADAKDTVRLAALATGKDAIISSMSPRGDNVREQYLAGIRSVLEVSKRVNIPHVLFVGGTSNLIAPDGKRILDHLLEQVPADKLEEPIIGSESRKLVEASDVNWTYFCPGGQIDPGERTGKYRIGGERSLVGLGEPSRISMEDYAKATIDELEHPQYIRQIFNVCY